MILHSKIGLSDHFFDMIRRSYSTVWGWALPAVIIGINAINSDYRSTIFENGYIGLIINYLIIWAIINAVQVAIFMAYSIFGPLKHARGIYTISLTDDTISDKSPTNTRLINLADIKEVKSDFRNGVEFIMKDGRKDGLFLRGNTTESIREFVRKVESKIRL